MWLILCHEGDLSAQWACAGLRTRGLAPVELITAEMLGPCVRWNHRITMRGSEVEITLSDTQVVRSREISGVLNRLREVPRWGLFQRLEAEDRCYATQELTAFFLSWISALPHPILNPPTPHGLAGRERSRAEWIELALSSGLVTHTYRQSSRTRPDMLTQDATEVSLPHVSELVIGQRSFGPAPTAIADDCRRLAERANTPILGISFAVNQNGAWIFVDANPLPDLKAGGEPALDALSEVLQGKIEWK